MCVTPCTLTLLLPFLTPVLLECIHAMSANVFLPAGNNGGGGCKGVTDHHWKRRRGGAA